MDLKRAACILCIVVLAGCSFMAGPVDTGTVTVRVVWQWRADREYAEGELCAYGPGNWISLQNENLGHKPWDWRLEQNPSPQWWQPYE